MTIVLRDPPRTALLNPGHTLWRVHHRAQGALYFGRAARGRFDAPAAQFGILYVGASGGIAVLETLVRGTAPPRVEQGALDQRGLSSLPVAREMRLLQFEGPGLAYLGIGAERAHGEPYAECQRMALDLWSTHPEIDGIQYRSRWDNSDLCWAIFDRAAPKLGAVRPAQHLGDVAVWAPLLDPYGVEVL